MVRNRRGPVWLVAIGMTLALVQLLLPNATGSLDRIQTLPSATLEPAAGLPALIWREFRPGERETGPGTTVRVCAAALQRETARSVLILRMCSSLPMTPRRRYALGFDDLVVRAELPGGGTLAYDLLDYVPARDGATGFTEGVLPENSVPLSTIKVVNLTDLVFVMDLMLPLGLPRIDVSARYAGRDTRDVVTFTALGPDLTQTEAARVESAPEWARARY